MKIVFGDYESRFQQLLPCPDHYRFVKGADDVLGRRWTLDDCVFLPGWENNPKYKSLEFTTAWRHACDKDLPFPKEAA